MEIFGYELGEMLTRQLIYFIIIFFIGVLLLHISTIILNFNKKSFGKAIVIILLGAIIMSFLDFIPYIGRLIGLIFIWYLIKNIYDVSWGKAILAWFVSVVVSFIIAFIILLIIGISAINISIF